VTSRLLRANPTIQGRPAHFDLVEMRCKGSEVSSS
jgi:hypothetical protein